jgi:hypothetical protein
MSTHPLDQLKPRGKPPATKQAIDKWIHDAEGEVGIGARRLGWMVASGVVVAAIQRALHTDGLPRFLIKGGAYLELRLGLRARTTKDVDTLFRGEFADFIDVLDEALAEPFDGLTFKRTEPEQINVPGRIVKPHRFDVLLQLRGKTWRRITLEVSPDEGGAGTTADRFRPPSLAHFGFNVPEMTAALVMDYQVAQKLHACTDPHTDEHPNDRVRDVVDLHLLKPAFYAAGSDLHPLADACRSLFAARADEARRTGQVTPRTWPPEIMAHPHWQMDYRTYAAQVELTLSLGEAVTALNDWITAIDLA